LVWYYDPNLLAPASNHGNWSRTEPRLKWFETERILSAAVWTDSATADVWTDSTTTDVWTDSTTTDVWTDSTTTDVWTDSTTTDVRGALKTTPNATSISDNHSYLLSRLGHYDKRIATLWTLGARF
jgi:hypothetical protein